MFPPGDHSERDVLHGYLAEQLTSIRNAAHGLTEDQARERPCRSSLSIGGILKHTVWVLRQREAQRSGDLGPDDVAAFTGSFTLTEQETLAGILAEFDAETTTYLDWVAGLDPSAAMTEPPTPWEGVHEPRPSVRRYALVHHVEEFARHAGHADVIREQLDGATALPLRMAVDGVPGNAFVQPWTP
ncbi:DinB family protein [Kineococcus gynurae]|uniref:DinB family protein n=1 Tax=Kineococcus gynurae TaxID=452979 RepID=A0ABV5LP35_9ACTN